MTMSLNGENLRQRGPGAARNVERRSVFLTLQQVDEWKRVLGRVAQHDFYFLPGYHAVAERRGEGSARLFVYEQGEYTLALPLLLRSLSDVAELGARAEGWHDTTSVYGYAGPLSSHQEVPATVVHGFQAALKDALLERRVITVFSRLHPLLSQRGLLAGIGECRPAGQTVSIDLTLPPEQQWKQYRGTLRSGLNRLRKSGAVCRVDDGMQHLPEFVNIYHETMRRVNAQGAYFFEPDYFSQLASGLGAALQLFVVRVDEEIAAAGLFTLCDGIVQYHLGGTRDAFRKLSPMTLLLDSVRLWGNAQGARVFHLGGGVGSQQDSLFHFKTGFSDCRHGFATWRWIIAPEIFQELSAERHRWNAERDLEPVSPDFFPAYRCSVLTRDGQTAGARAAAATPLPAAANLLG